MRREFRLAVKKAAWARSGGRCETCGHAFVLTAGDGPEYDHDNPDALTGEPTLANCVVRCRPCHRAKTAADRPAITKAHRLARKAKGLTGSKAVIPGSRASRWKRKISGEIERRD